MKYIDITTDPEAKEAVASLLNRNQAWLVRRAQDTETNRYIFQVALHASEIQDLLDELTQLNEKMPNALHVMVFEAESVIPEHKLDLEAEKKNEAASTYREQIYKNIEQNARLNLHFLLLVALSTVVAAIGMIEDNVAVIIGGMVIAPLLGPNLALGLATALADLELMKKSLITGLAGLFLAIGLSMVIALIFPIDIYVGEIASRTHVEFAAVALALASGAAAALSVSTGVASVLVGVMVAVALLPPAVAFGIMLATGHFDLALGAGLLLAINVVSVNLSSKIVFFFKGIRPNKGIAFKTAQGTMVRYFVIWLVTLSLLVLMVYLTQF